MACVVGWIRRCLCCLIIWAFVKCWAWLVILVGEGRLWKMRWITSLPYMLVYCRLLHHLWHVPMPTSLHSMICALSSANMAPQLSQNDSTTLISALNLMAKLQVSLIDPKVLTFVLIFDSVMFWSSFSFMKDWKFVILPQLADIKSPHNLRLEILNSCSTQLQPHKFAFL